MGKHYKNQTKRSLEKKLDAIFSEFIRLRDADDNGYVRCITCGCAYPWKGTSNMHNGHYINRDVKATRYNEVNCNGQCESCNDYHSGKIYLYRQRLIEKYGEDAVLNIERLADMGGSYDHIWLQMKIDEYKEKVKRLKKEKCL